jgi:hypothetical protein
VPRAGEVVMRIVAEAEQALRAARSHIV